jgi:hypothetical protein
MYWPAVAEVEEAAEDLVAAGEEPAVSAEVALDRVEAFLAEVESAGQVPDTVAEAVEQDGQVRESAASVEPAVQVLEALVASEVPVGRVWEESAASAVQVGLVPELVASEVRDGPGPGLAASEGSEPVVLACVPVVLLVWREEHTFVRQPCWERRGERFETVSHTNTPD